MPFNLGSRINNGLVKLLNVRPTGSPIAGSAREKSIPTNTIPLFEMRESMTSGASSGFSQPVWGPELSTIGAYSREGYTSKTFDTPIVPFKEQVYYLERDEDIQLSLNDLTSQITGGAHYWKSTSEELSDYLKRFSKDSLDFDWFDQIMVKEALYFGNSVWKPRNGLQGIRGPDDLMHIPIASFVRVWWDRQRKPYKYEFRGAEYQGYHNPNDIIHFCWNPINASVFGNGYGTALSARKDFESLTPTGTTLKSLPNLMDMKYNAQMVNSLSARRYMPRNVYVMQDGSQEDKALLQSDLSTLEDNEDFVATKALEVQELGSNQRAYDPSQYQDLVQSSIFKALNNLRGKQAGESNHSYANAESSEERDEIGLSSFPVAIISQVVNKLVKPWYEANQMYDPSYMYGMVGVPWEEFDPELNFGDVVKKDIEPEMLIKLIELGVQTGAVQDPIEIRDLIEKAGAPLSKEYKEQMNQMYNNYNAMPSDVQQPAAQPVQTYSPYQNTNDFDTQPADQQARPMDSPWYTAEPAGYLPPGIDVQPSDPRINFTKTTIPKQVPGRTKTKKKKVKLPGKLDIADINEFLNDFNS